MIYITGANGWLGLNLLKCINSGSAEKWGINNIGINALILPGSDKEKIYNISNDIKIIELDITKRKDVKSFFNSIDINEDKILFHLAGIIHPKKVSDFYEVNFKGSMNILDGSMFSSFKKVVIMSSNSPCGCNIDNTSSFDENSPYNPYMNYGKSKMKMEKMVKKHFEDGKLDITIIRAPWFYGPYQPDRQKLFFEMIRKGKVPIVGDGTNKRSMAFTENLVQGLSLAASKSIASGKTYWISDKLPYSMNEIVDEIEDIMINDLKLNVTHGRLKLPGIFSDLAEYTDLFLQSLGLYHQKIHVLSEMNKNIACKIDLASNELGYSPQFSLREGMSISLKEFYT